MRFSTQRERWLWYAGSASIYSLPLEQPARLQSQGLWLYTHYRSRNQSCSLFSLSLSFFFPYLHNISCLSLFPYRSFVYWIDGAHHIRVSIETLLLSLSLWSSIYYWLLSMRWILFIHQPSLYVPKKRTWFPHNRRQQKRRVLYGNCQTVRHVNCINNFPAPLQKVPS